LDAAQLGRKLRLEAKEAAELLKRLELAGKVARVRHDCWVRAKEAELLTGQIVFNAKGFAFVIPEEGGEDLYIAAEDTGTAMHEDTVTARLVKEPERRGGRDAGRLRGRVIRVLQRKRDHLVGTLQRSGLFYYVAPDDPRLVHNIYVPAPGSAAQPIQAAVDDKVVVRLTAWESRHLNPEGVLVERLGRTGDPGVDILSIIRKFNLPTTFPSEVLDEVKAFPEPFGNAEPGPGRIDCRGDYVITIDPDTAKDFDDAISVKSAGKGLWEVGVHIADVSAYVSPGTALDAEARKRGNSVYLVNQVIPMLPEELSNGLCSLRPQVDRLTYAAFILLDEHGCARGARFGRAVIHSRHRLTYRQALERLEKKAPEDELDRFLHQAWKLASALRKKRFKDGSLDLDMPSVKVICDPEGKPVRLEREANDISHQLIEEFMLLANEQVAKVLTDKHRPALYRVHEPPDEEKLLELREKLALFGLKTGDLTNKHEMARVLQKIKQMPESYTLSIDVLRSLKRAQYHPQPLGHYGLSKSNYTHFTSPIRRYSDLVVHRALAGLAGKKGGEESRDLPRLAQHLSATERTAAEAEQESVTLKKMEFFERQVGSGQKQVFDAVILNVSNYGFFVELPEFLVSGLVHVSSLEGDFYHYLEAQQSLVGRKSRRTFQSGQKVKVHVQRIDKLKRQIDFTVAA
jgi:ribonuclease R